MGGLGCGCSRAAYFVVLRLGWRHISGMLIPTQGVAFYPLNRDFFILGLGHVNRKMQL